MLSGDGLQARDNLLSCSLDGLGTPNEFGVCVEFPAETRQPGFYCTDEMRITYLACSPRNRVGSCEMSSESGPFIVHYYGPQRQGSSLRDYCEARGKYHPPSMQYNLSLAKKEPARLHFQTVLEETKEVAAWPEQSNPAAPRPASAGHPCSAMAAMLQSLFDRSPASGGCEEFARGAQESIKNAPGLDEDARLYLNMRAQLVCEARQKGDSSAALFEREMRTRKVCTE